MEQNPEKHQGALTQFFDTNVKSAIAQTAQEIRQEVRDASNSARVQVTSEGVTIGSTTLTGEQLASTISTSPRGIDFIAPKIKVKSDMLVDGAITASKIAAGSVTTNAFIVVEMILLIPSQIVVTVSLIAPKTVLMMSLIALITVEMIVLIPSQTVFAIPLIASQAPLQSPLITAVTVLIIPAITFKIVEIRVW